MAYVSVTNVFANGTTANAPDVNQNFTDLVNGLKVGTYDLNMSAATFASSLGTAGNFAVAGSAAVTGDLTVTLGSDIKSTDWVDYSSAITSPDYPTGWDIEQFAWYKIVGKIMYFKAALTAHSTNTIYRIILPYDCQQSFVYSFNSFLVKPVYYSDVGTSQQGWGIGTIDGGVQNQFRVWSAGYNGFSDNGSVVTVNIDTYFELE